MINLEKIKYEKCQPPFLRIPAPEPYFFYFSNTTPDNLNWQVLWGKDKYLLNSYETVQYNAALAIATSTLGTSKVKLYQDLGLELLKSRWWFRCFTCCIKSTLPAFHPI